MSMSVVIFFFSGGRRHTRWSVTGVQTCALPILGAGNLRWGTLQRSETGAHAARTGIRLVLSGFLADLRLDDVSDVVIDRSEERRVGKECRSRWLRDELKERRARETGDGTELAHV